MKLTMVRRSAAAHGGIALSDRARDEVDGVRAALRRAVVEADVGEEQRALATRGLLRDTWRGLVDGRWALVDHFESEGRIYVVATVAPVTPRPARPASLTKRETEVLRAAARGLSNKEIASELGVAFATIRVLVHRAARKLGTVDRAVAIARFCALAGEPQPPPAARLASSERDRTPSLR
jgi:DNA-binding CsgD family transcriptional regulator